MNIPEGYQAVMPYLIVNDARGFIAFLKKVFGGTEKMLELRDDHKVMHAEVMINGSVIMLADATEAYPPKAAGMFVYVDDVDKVYALALREGCHSLMPPDKKEYGRAAGFNDVYGNTWWPITP